MDVASVLTLVLLGLSLAVQPWSVLAAILLVTSRGGLRKECGFVGGWLVALTAVAIGTVLAYPGVAQTATTSSTHSGIELAAGVIVGGWLLWRWRRPRDPGTSSQPSWMTRLDSMSPLVAFGLGAFLPTYVIVVAAVSEMISSGLTQGWLLVVALAWVVLASTGVASPLFVLVRHRHSAPATYQRWRTWIIANSRAVLYSVGGLVCVALSAKGIVGLLG
ncbi:MAG: GAP family protein [Humibacillus sp.]|nr:GAP family protein [Humibacillus sp.]MDN5776569.1 GAP family protein [Humibacillus sp.]